MIKKIFVLAAFISLHHCTLPAQQKKPVAGAVARPVKDSLVIPVSKADLGTFPYFKTLPNFTATDSDNVENNLTYFYDGKKFFTVEGKVSKQNLNIKNSAQKIVSEFGCIQEFDKVITTLGGIKVYTGRLPVEQLKTFAGKDIVELGSKGQMAPSAYEGIVEYVIKTPEKEVWVQLEPYSLVSQFYTLLVVEKSTPLFVLNTNKHNQLLEALEKEKKAIVHLAFEPDNATLLSESKDEILSIAGVFQAHPDWKLQVECSNAPVGKPEYTLALTGKRADAVKEALLALGVKAASISAKGVGDQKPIVLNDTEQGRLTNTRIEITLQ